MTKDSYPGIEHLDLTGLVEQTEDQPRFAGGFGKVYYGELCSDTGVVNVAIKRVSLSGDQKFAKAIVYKELKIWSRLDHQNVLRLCGYTLEDGSLPALVSEWMTNGTMLKYVTMNPQVELFSMVKGIADGLSYLHDMGVIHADLKSDNVLISPSGAPLLTDFGISRTLIVTHTVTTLGELTGSVRWMAYELIAPHCQLQNTADATTITEIQPAIPSKETDVWAFGMVVYELLAKEYPFSPYSTVQVIIAIAFGHLPRPPSNLRSHGNIGKSLWDLCTQCWNRDPTSRPVMTDVVREINGWNFGDASDRSIGDSKGYAEIAPDPSYSRPQRSLGPDTSSSARTTLKDSLRSIEHLDLTNRVEQTEGRRRFCGSFSKVYYGKLRLDSGFNNVAIKRAECWLPEDKIYANAMIKELKIWSRLDHQNILRLWGYTLDDEECPALISEWMTNGTVLSYLKLNPQVDLLDLVKGIADGLAYLHKEGVVHGDLKSDDVLISPSGVPLLTDFGISRAMVLTHTVTWSRELMGSVRWMAYELIAPQESGPQKIVDTSFESTITETKPGVPSMETDVWAFGMVVYELLTKEYPFARYSNCQAVCVIAMGNLPSPPSDLQSRRSIDKALWDLCTRCWNRVPTSRPVMTDVVREVNDRNFGNSSTTNPKDHSKANEEIGPHASYSKPQKSPILPSVSRVLQRFLERKSRQQPLEKPS